MANTELRHIDLKGRILSLEISALETKSKEISNNLKKQNDAMKHTQSEWEKCLKNALKAYKQTSTQVQVQVIQSKIKTLSEFKRLMSERKRETIKAQTSLNNLIELAKHKNKHLEICKSISNSKQNLEKEKGAQIESDQSALLFCLQKMKNQQEKIDIPESDKDLVEGILNTNDRVDYLNHTASLETNITTTSNQQTDNLAVNKPDAILKNETEYDADGNNDDSQQNESRQLWRKAKDISDLREQSNQKVQLLHVSTEQGNRVFIDYQPKPGRIISIEGNKLKGNSTIELALRTSSNNDRLTIKNSKQELLNNMLSSGLKISDLRID